MPLRPLAANFVPTLYSGSWPRATAAGAGSGSAGAAAWTDESLRCLSERKAVENGERWWRVEINITNIIRHTNILYEEHPIESKINPADLLEVFRTNNMSSEVLGYVGKHRCRSIEYRNSLLKCQIGYLILGGKILFIIKNSLEEWPRNTPRWAR